MSEKDDAARFRWLAAQENLRLIADRSIWHHGGGKASFRGWGYMSVNSRSYPAAATLEELVDLAREDQGGGR